MKSRKEILLDDLKETFDNLRVYKMMLNPAKCVFDVPSGKLLGFLVSNRGIEANSEKIKAITSLAKPACINDVQHLAGRIAAPNRFISQLGEKAIPLYQMMKKTDNFVWSDAANAAFEDLKNQLFLLPPLIRNHCCYMWLLMPVLLAWLLWWSARKLERSIQFNGRFIISVRYLLSQSKDIRIGRSLCMEFLWRAGSLSNTFKAILSLWSVPLHWELSFRTRRRLTG